MCEPRESRGGEAVSQREIRELAGANRVRAAAAKGRFPKGNSRACWCEPREIFVTEQKNQITFLGVFL
ncbi:MAG: hypothetical protein HFE62_03345 [Firmicutes bacterium]|nr:hypothetical protein [Bacillota bacterium]